MTLQTFIFSNKTKHRLSRHAAFWVAACLLKFYSDLYGDSFSDVFSPGSIKQSLSSLICFIPLYIFSTYSFIWLVPRYLQKRRYTAFVIAALIVALCNFMAGIFLSMLHFEICDWHFTGTDISLAPIRTSIYQGIMLAFITTGGVVTAIKLTKSWYLQQIENTKLAKLKSDKEIKLLKAHIRPAFLSQSLNILRKKISYCEADAPEMLLQLSELLSHLLYDNDTELTSLGQELRMAALLIDIKKFDKQRNLSATISIHGDEEKKYISPLLLFSYLQTVLNDLEKSEDKNPTLDIVLTIEDKMLFCELHGYTESFTQFAIFNSLARSQTIKMARSQLYA
jgi:hypothetical protein